MKHGHPEHSDAANTDYAEAVGYDRGGPKWRPVFLRDAEDYVCQLLYWLTPEEMTSAEWIQHMHDTRDRYPFDRSDIEWPNPRAMFGRGLLTTWPVDEDGRGISVMEMKERLTMEKAA